MLFQITWIRQVQGKPQNLSFVVDAPDEATLRDFCGKNSMAIFELKPYTEPKQNFGKVVVKVLFGGITFEIITPFEKAKEAYNYVTEVGLQVTYINNFDHLMSDEDVAMILQKLKAEYEEEHKKAKVRTSLADVNTSNVVLQTDPELEKMKRIATQAITDMEEIRGKSMTGMALRKVNDLKELEEELKKTKMGSNIPKMRSLVSDAYKMMEEMEMQYLDQQKAAEATLIESSVVTHLDLIREYEKYEKAQKVKKGKLEKTPSDIYYIFFGKAGMYQRFLGKDIWKRLEDRGEILYKWIDYMIIFIFMCIVWLTITSLYQHYILKQEVFFFGFVDFALIGLILIAINKLKRRNTFQILMLFVIGTVIYFALRYLLINNFAL